MRQHVLPHMGFGGGVPAATMPKTRGSEGTGLRSRRAGEASQSLSVIAPLVSHAHVSPQDHSGPTPDWSLYRGSWRGCPVNPSRRPCARKWHQWAVTSSQPTNERMRPLRATVRSAELFLICVSRRCTFSASNLSGTMRLVRAKQRLTMRSRHVPRSVPRCSYGPRALRENHQPVPWPATVARVRRAPYFSHLVTADLLDNP